MRWEKLKIKDFTEVATGGTPSTQKKEFWRGGSIPWLNSGELNQGDIFMSSNFITQKGLENSSAKMMPPNTVLIALTGATTGVTAYLQIQACANQSVTGILPSDKHHPRYLYHYLKSIRSKILNDSYGGAQKHISQAYVKEIKVPLPPLHIQDKVSVILDKADDIRKKDLLLIAEYNKLAQSIFLDIFGDPVKNEKKWQLGSLSQFGSFKNGLNYSRNESGVNIKCLGVGDFKNLTKFDDINSLTTLSLTNKPSAEYYLKDGDLVFVRSNGNKELVGRCLVAYPGAAKVTFSGFCIRYRPISETINTVFLAYLFRVPAFRSVMLHNGKGANIQNINQKLLEGLKIPIPAIKLQSQFAEIIQNIDKQVQIAKNQLEQSEKLFQSLLQRAFRGELVK